MKYVFAIAVLVFATVGARAQSVVADPAPDAVHVIAGTVLYDRTGVPSDRLEVQLVPETGAGRYDTFTEAAGRFRFEGLQAGTYTITVRAPYRSGFDDGQARVTVYSSKTPTSYSVVVTLPARSGPPVVANLPAGAPATVPAVAPAARAAYARAQEAMKRGDDAEATARLEEAVALAPTWADALNDLGVARMRAGRTSDAVSCFQRAADASPERFEPRVNLALALLAAGTLDDAESQVARALSIDGDSARALFAGGRIALARGDLATAASRLQRSVAAGGDTQAAAAVALGEVCERAGQVASAVEAYRIALAAEPEGPRADAAHARLKALGVE